MYVSKRGPAALFDTLSQQSQKDTLRVCAVFAHSSCVDACLDERDRVFYARALFIAAIYMEIFLSDRVWATVCDA